MRDNTKYKLPNGDEVSPETYWQLEECCCGSAMELLDDIGVRVQQDGRPLGLLQRIANLERKRCDLKDALRGLMHAIEKVQDWDTDTRVGIEIANAKDALAN